MCRVSRELPVCLQGRAAVRRCSSLALLVLCVLLTSPARAQVSATLSGMVTDQSGASVSDAHVTVQNVETGVVRATTTDSAGLYQVFALPVGEYEVRAKKAGFTEK
jgi:Carboxypeptidase regulatory-like domain